MKQFDVTVKQWQLIQSIVENEDNELLRWLDIMPILTDKTREHYRAMLSSDFWKEANQYKFGLFEKPLQGPMPTRWEHKGRVMVCDPRLNKITGGRFIDSLELSKEYRGDPYLLMHKFLAIYWMDEPKKKWFSRFLPTRTNPKYDPDTYQERHEYILENMPVYIALPTYTHFFQLWIESLPAIQLYLSKKAAGIGSPTGGGGTLHSTGWRRVTGKIGTTLRKWVSLSSLTTWRTSPTKAKGRTR